MRKQIKLAALVAATGLVAASTQAAVYNGDLIVGFTSGSGTDVIYDLGAESLFTPGNTTPLTWNLGSTGANLLSGFTLSTVNWGVIGDNLSSQTVWTTTAGDPPRDISGYNDINGNVNNPTHAIYNSVGIAGAGNSGSVDASAGNSWNVETLNPTLSTDYANSFNTPNVSGETVDNLYISQGYNTDPVLLGSFSLSSSGVLSFDPVPEPSTVGLLTGAGLLMVALRNKFRRVA